MPRRFRCCAQIVQVVEWPLHSLAPRRPRLCLVASLGPVATFRRPPFGELSETARCTSVVNATQARQFADEECRCPARRRRLVSAAIIMLERAVRRRRCAGHHVGCRRAGGGAPAWVNSSLINPSRSARPARAPTTLRRKPMRSVLGFLLLAGLAIAASAGLSLTSPGESGSRASTSSPARALSTRPRFSLGCCSGWGRWSLACPGPHCRAAPLPGSPPASAHSIALRGGGPVPRDPDLLLSGRSDAPGTPAPAAHRYTSSLSTPRPAGRPRRDVQFKLDALNFFLNPTCAAARAFGVLLMTTCGLVAGQDQRSDRQRLDRHRRARARDRRRKEPNSSSAECAPAVGPYKSSLVKDGIPARAAL